MRAILFIGAIIIYLIFYGLYLWNLLTIPMTLEKQKIWNYSCIGGLVLSMLVLYLRGINTFILQQFFVIAFIILLVTFIIIILVNLLIISNPFYILGLFYASNFLFAVMVLLAGIRHGIFKT